METKPSLILILYCFLLASFLFFPHGADSRKLLPGEEEDGNGPKKAGVKRSRSSSAPSWVGHDSPPNNPPSPPSQKSFENQVRSEAEQEAQREACEYSRSYTNAYCSP
ncbi:hypothetical protein ES319_A13G030400v1 [Gossypium barbadense]|uniref:Uncharacterized protein n=4 Tax=Gossypium TaxID=3633 RepID=A0A2P5WGB3_GOSBA|nr:uncharacterized protein LOC108463546 [Gossypium arboreum]KAB2047227.1 hypothetical protein ES319_A13G030400v1 [Gossypium barbadense]TYG85133.1 hypothetical protein ES288_A13G028500v1 [Gossypium darwinii]TYH90170.1 hypothetical protein ES332_A13G031700v1 [Gossypium tomentosum]KAK5770341.1 hypothetical protein PVK06_046491 [Gossypium arboreum]PPR90095.1 hypothetical protein GOBAR_AA30582 [Gossypium barbadense]